MLSKKEKQSSMKDILHSFNNNANSNYSKHSKSLDEHQRKRSDELNPVREPSLSFRNSFSSTSSKSSITGDKNQNQGDYSKKIVNNSSHPLRTKLCKKNNHELLRIAKKNYDAEHIYSHDEDDEDEEIVYNSKDYSRNYNFNNNCNKNVKIKCGYDKLSDIEFKDNKPQFNLNNSMNDDVKKKFNRANRIFYNGYLKKQDCSNMPECQERAAELLYFLKYLWVGNQLCDLSIVIDKKKYPAHKIALAMFSQKYRDEFQKILQSSKEPPQYTITLTNNTTHESLESILKYIYTAKIDINPSNVEDILYASKQLGIDDLIRMTSEYLDSFSFGDVMDFMANDLRREGSEIIFFELYKYIMKHLDKISRTPEYLESSAFVVKTILKDSNLEVNSELEVFDAAMRWIDYDKQGRTKYIREIMKVVRFTLITPDELVSKVENQPNLNNNPDVFRMIYNSFKYHALNNEATKSKLSLIVKREDERNKCKTGASLSDDFVKSIIQLCEIAQKFKQERNFKTNNLLNYE